MDKTKSLYTQYQNVLNVVQPNQTSGHFYQKGTNLKLNLNIDQFAIKKPSTQNTARKYGLDSDRPKEVPKTKTSQSGLGQLDDIH